MVSILREKFAHLNLTFSIGGQISFDVSKVKLINLDAVLESLKTVDKKPCLFCWDSYDRFSLMVGIKLTA